MDLEARLLSLGQDLALRTAAETLDEYLDLVRAGEYGVALEILCDRLDDAQAPLLRSDVEVIQALAREMQLDRPSIAFIRDLIPEGE
ncbi:MafI family immunity protein [Luteimicrobium subarcticum]|uniref:MafI family immunity protein n=1 Tax=Luteimicrobium subarcticum TaxID=620910 RepID=A0A2M8W481_9MICO|nr:MafI family immunity protein [Luteimicrobium subarcticum]PJI85732.1 hypothetical protein CLV34_2923 [Luteimicrobium subarcticum]